MSILYIFAADTMNNCKVAYGCCVAQLSQNMTGLAWMRCRYGAPLNKRLVFFIDDINMPAREKYGAQPPIELLRQFQDLKGFYDRKKLFWKDIEDTVLCAACAPPGGGRQEVTPR
jgi:hypothetical protein